MQTSDTNLPKVTNDRHELLKWLISHFRGVGDSVLVRRVVLKPRGRTEFSGHYLEISRREAPGCSHYRLCEGQRRGDSEVAAQICH